MDKTSYYRLPAKSLMSSETSNNITIVLSSKRNKGVILYHGREQHAAVEIFRGRIRVSFDIGNYPVSTMYSYQEVSDGKKHVVELLMMGKNFTMRVDGGMPRTILNEGDKKHMAVEDYVYLGGLPAALKLVTFQKWHIRDSTSFNGEIQSSLFYEIIQSGILTRSIFPINHYVFISKYSSL